MDPVRKIWYFENWLADRTDNIELAKNHAYLLASFDHPEAVKQIVGHDNKHTSTDEEFEESSRMVQEMNARSQNVNAIPTKKRRRRATLT